MAHMTTIPTEAELAEYAVDDTVTIKEDTGQFSGRTGTIAVVKGWETEGERLVWVGELGVRFPGIGTYAWFYPAHLTRWY